MSIKVTRVQSAANLAAATVTDAKLASPNNSVYKVLYRNAHRATTSGASATTYLVSGGTDVTALAITAAGALGPLGIYFDDADYIVAGVTQKLRLRVTMGCGSTPPAQTFTYTLNPLTISTSTITVGAAVTNSTVAITTPGASAFTTNATADFAIPADGFYCVSYTISGTPAANTSAQVVIESRNT